MSDNPERLNADMLSEHFVKMTQFLTTAVELADKDPDKLDDAADYAQAVTDSLRSFAEMLRARAREDGN
jgi:hypothetical protein